MIFCIKKVGKLKQIPVALLASEICWNKIPTNDSSKSNNVEDKTKSRALKRRLIENEERNNIHKKLYR